jgi:hypothetical protein
MKYSLRSLVTVILWRPLLAYPRRGRHLHSLLFLGSFQGDLDIQAV